MFFNIKNCKYFKIKIFVFMVIMNVLPLSVQAMWNGENNDEYNKTPPSSPRTSVKNDSIGECATQPQILHPTISFLLNDREDTKEEEKKSIRQRNLVSKRIMLSPEAEKELLVTQFIPMNEEKFTEYLLRNTPQTIATIQYILEKQEGINQLIQHPGWIKKLECLLPSHIIKYLQEPFYTKLSEKEESRYPGLLISKIFFDPNEAPKLFLFSYITVSFLNAFLPTSEAKSLETQLWGRIKGHLNDTRRSCDESKEVSRYTKAHAFLLWRHHEEAIDALVNPDEEPIAELHNIFRELTSQEKSDLAVYIRFVKGGADIFKNPRRALTWLKIAAGKGNDKDSFIHLGLYYQHMGNYPTALHYFSTLSNLQPNNLKSNIFANMGWMKEQLRDRAKAEEYYTKADSDPFVLLKLMWLYKEQGKKEKTEEIKERLKNYLNEVRKNLQRKGEFLNWTQEEKKKTLTSTTSEFSTDLRLEKQKSEKTFSKEEEKREEFEEKSTTHFLTSRESSGIKPKPSMDAALVAVYLNQFDIAKEIVNSGRASIPVTSFSPYRGAQHLIAAYVKHILKSYDATFVPSNYVAEHLDIIKDWSSKILEKNSSFAPFSFMTFCFGPYSIENLKNITVEEILKQMLEHYKIYAEL